MKNGDVVFFKKAKKSSNRKAQEVQFQGHAFGVLLGHVPLFKKDPEPIDLLRAMGMIGYLTFDDVADFLGEDAAHTCIKKYEDKYYGKEMTPEELAARGLNPDGSPMQEVPGESMVETAMNKETSKLLNAAGLPLTPPEGSPLIVIPGEGLNGNN